MQEINLSNDYVLIQPLVEKEKKSKSGIVIDVSNYINIFGKILKVADNIDFLKENDVVFFNKSNCVEMGDNLIVNASEKYNKIYYIKKKK